MNIGLLTATHPELRPQVGADASSGASAETIANEALVVAAAKPRPTVNIAPSINYPSMRAALDAQIAADVSFGTLSQDHAAAVRTTLDAVDNRSAGPGMRLNPPLAVRAYLSTIPRGTLVDRAA